MEGLMDLVSLKRLYIEKNCISKLDGLDNCRMLEELYIGNQELPPGAEFTFDEYSLAAISSTLRVLDLPNSQVVNPKPLYYLEGLETLNMKENLIEDFENQVCPLLQTMNNLRILNLAKCPVTQITKYRDQVVLLSKSVAELDGKNILDSERKYLFNLISRKKV
jgi:protein phosphatase 1 regulatory subunit 42